MEAVIDGASEEEFPMKIVPVICFALAAAVAGSMLPVSFSYALTYPSQAQNCASTGSTYSSEGVGNCKSSKEHGGNLGRSASAGHSVSATRVGR